MQPRPLKRLKRFCRYYLFRLLIAWAKLLPLSAAIRVGGWLGGCAFRFSRKERSKALQSLAIAYPEMNETTRETLARDCFIQFGRVAAETTLVEKIDPQIERFAVLPERDRQLLVDALTEGRGIVFVTGHFGNFELLARRIARDGFPCQTIAQQTSCPRTTAYILRLRERGHLRSILRGSPTAAREMLRALRKNELLGLLIDVDTHVQSLFVDFFGKLASTPRSAADLAVRLKAAVITGFAFPRPDGGYEIRLNRIPLPETGGKESDVLALTQTLTSEIEQAIRKEPKAWAWMHERWKTRPAS